MNTIEINGTRYEVDIEAVKRVERFRVGDKVKVLVRNYDGKHDSYPGVIVGFDAFPRLPTIVVAYLQMDYSSASIRFASINAESQNYQIAPMLKDELTCLRADAVSLLDREIEKKRAELTDLETKREMFLKRLGDVVPEPKP